MTIKNPAITSTIEQYAAEQEAERKNAPTITMDDGDPYFLPPTEVTLLLMRHSLAIIDMPEVA